MKTEIIRRRKDITIDIEENFGRILEELLETEIVQKPKKKTSTDLIIAHRATIQALLDKGHSFEQIRDQLAKINLIISTDTIRAVLRKTDKDGNRIIKAPTGKKTKGSTTTRKNKPGDLTPPVMEYEDL